MDGQAAPDWSALPLLHLDGGVQQSALVSTQSDLESVVRSQADAHKQDTSSDSTTRDLGAVPFERPEPPERNAASEKASCRKCLVADISIQVHPFRVKHFILPSHLELAKWPSS